MARSIRSEASVPIRNDGEHSIDGQSFFECGGELRRRFADADEINKASDIQIAALDSGGDESRGIALRKGIFVNRSKHRAVDRHRRQSIELH